MFGNNVFDCYSRQFSTGSRLHYLLVTLQREHNIQLVWRPTAPAGGCGITNNPLHSKHFYEKYNEIVHKFIASLPEPVPFIDLWNASIPKWREHISPTDALHYCLFTKVNVPALWNSLLAEILQPEAAGSGFNNVWDISPTGVSLIVVRWSWLIVAVCVVGYAYKLRSGARL